MDATILWDLIYHFLNVLVDLGGFLFTTTYIPALNISVTPVYLLIGEGVLLYIAYTLIKYFVDL